MRVLIDTNILISAALSANGTPFKAFVKAVTYPNHGMVCEQNIDEMRRIFNRKFPKKIAAFEQFLHGVLRFRTAVDGETIKKIDVYMGYIHRGIEKICEKLTYPQTLHFMDRIDRKSVV